MKTDEIVATLLILPFLMFAWVFVTFWPIVLGLITLFVIWIIYDSWEPPRLWKRFDPPQWVAGQKYLLAKGCVKAGYFALYRECVRPRKDIYPKLLTLVITDRNGKVISAVSRLVQDWHSDGPVTVGSFRGRDVVIDAEIWSAKHTIDMTQADSFPNWQVYPPTDKSQLIPVQL